MSVDVDAHQSVAAGSYPDIPATVACHRVDAEVNVGACQSQLVADSGIPRVHLFVVDKECALSVEPDIVKLVGKDFQRIGIAQTALGYLHVPPWRCLLSADITAYDTTVIVDHKRAIKAFADGAVGPPEVPLFPDEYCGSWVSNYGSTLTLTKRADGMCAFTLVEGGTTQGGILGVFELFPNDIDTAWSLLNADGTPLDDNLRITCEDGAIRLKASMGQEFFNR